MDTTSFGLLQMTDWQWPILPFDLFMRDRRWMLAPNMQYGKRTEAKGRVILFSLSYL